MSLLDSASFGHHFEPQLILVAIWLLLLVKRAAYRSRWWSINHILFLDAVLLRLLLQRIRADVLNLMEQARAVQLSHWLLLGVRLTDWDLWRGSRVVRDLAVLVRRLFVLKYLRLVEFSFLLDGFSRRRFLDFVEFTDVRYAVVSGQLRARYLSSWSNEGDVLLVDVLLVTILRSISNVTHCWVTWIFAALNFDKLSF